MSQRMIELTCVESNAFTGFMPRKLAVDPSDIASLVELQDNPLKTKTFITTKLMMPVYDDDDRMGMANITYSVQETWSEVRELMTSTPNQGR